MMMMMVQWTVKEYLLKVYYMQKIEGEEGNGLKETCMPTSETIAQRKLKVSKELEAYLCVQISLQICDSGRSLNLSKP